jgi:small subunit ribosomal protein S8
MRHDLLADALSLINNSEKAGKSSCTIKPTSGLVKKVLDLFKREGYILGYEYTDDKRGGIIIVSLGGKINKTGSVKPRFPAKKDELEKFEKRYLPSKDFGFIIVSTPQGLLTHNEAKQKNIGGKLIAFIY